MNDIKISDMLNMQKDLYELHKDKWSPLEAEYGRNFILWMMEEIGECIAIIKKKGDLAIMEDENVRKAFCEEMSDVLMYFNDTLLRYGITADEISSSYIDKHKKTWSVIILKNIRVNIKNNKLQFIVEVIRNILKESSKSV